MKRKIKKLGKKILSRKLTEETSLHPLRQKVDRKRKEIERKLRIPKIMFAVLFAALFIVLSKTKMLPIIGTDMNFSLGVMFGPALGALLGVPLGIFAILLSQAAGTAIGLYAVEDTLSLLVFFPILIGSVYFARAFRGDRKMIVIPVVCFAAFLLHPIGREVWFYSLFWLIPIVVIAFKEKIDAVLKKSVARTYAYSLGTAFTDHSVGSVVYLWFLNIPAQFWVMAIPMTLIERLIIALGITFSFHGVKAGIKALQDAAVAIAHASPEAEKNKHAIPVPAG